MDTRSRTLGITAIGTLVILAAGTAADAGPTPTSPTVAAGSSSTFPQQQARTSATTAMHKPKIVIVVTIDANDSTLMERMGRDLRVKTKADIESFLAEQFAKSLAGVKELKMFLFTSAFGQPSVTLRIGVSSKQLGKWPFADVLATVEQTSRLTGRSPSTFKFTLFWNALCNGRCFPLSFADSSWYATRIHDLLSQWPRGLLTDIEVVDRASYDGGRIEFSGDVEEFGGRESALFSIDYKPSRQAQPPQIQRRFTLCGGDAGLVFGLDQERNDSPICVTPHPNGFPPGVGRVTLVKAFVQ